MKKNLLITALVLTTFFGCKKESAPKVEGNAKVESIAKKPTAEKITRPQKVTMYEYNFYPLTDLGDGNYTFYAHGTTWIMSDLRDEIDWVENKAAQGTLAGTVDGTGMPSSGEHSTSVVGYIYTWGGGPSTGGVLAWEDAIQTWINYSIANNGNVSGPFPLSSTYITQSPNSQEWLKGVLIRTSNSESTYAVVEGRYPVVP